MSRVAGCILLGLTCAWLAAGKPAVASDPRKVAKRETCHSIRISQPGVKRPLYVQVTSGPFGWLRPTLLSRDSTTMAGPVRATWDYIGDPRTGEYIGSGYLKVSPLGTRTFEEAARVWHAAIEGRWSGAEWTIIRLPDFPKQKVRKLGAARLPSYQVRYSVRRVGGGTAEPSQVTTRLYRVEDKLLSLSSYRHGHSNIETLFMGGVSIVRSPKPAKKTPVRIVERRSGGSSEFVSLITPRKLAWSPLRPSATDRRIVASWMREDLTDGSRYRGLVLARMAVSKDDTLEAYAKRLTASYRKRGYQLDQPDDGHIDGRPYLLLRLIMPGKDEAPPTAVAWSVVWREGDRVWVLRWDVRLTKGVSMAAERRELLGVVRATAMWTTQGR